MTSRAFKFRAWNAYAKEMRPVPLLHLYNENVNISPTLEGSYMSLVYHPKTVLMQFTGCIDKNDVDIYEGDIVKDSSTNATWVITWNAEAGGWTDQDNNPYSYGLYKSLEKSLEVIGNIYENPELLK